MKKNFTIFMALMTSLLISAAAFGQADHQPVRRKYIFFKKSFADFNYDNATNP